MPDANAGIHHFAIGEITVTALHDGVLQAATGYVAGLAGAEAEALLEAGFRAVPPRITISCFLVERGGQRLLIDAGSGTALGEGHGLARARLTALGVSPAEIGTILVTHAHVDHVSGLLDEGGRPFFPAAELVLHEAEPAFWLDEAIAAGAPEAAKQSFEIARRALAPYRDRIRTVRHGEAAAPGIVAHHLPGHTPGHCGWMIADGSDVLFVWGDVVHLPGIQFARPEAGLVFDVDLAQGQATRARTFDMAATDRLRVAGMHLDFPTFGHVVKASEGYAFVPEVWRPSAR